MHLTSLNLRYSWIGGNVSWEIQTLIQIIIFVSETVVSDLPGFVNVAIENKHWIWHPQHWTI